MLTLLELHYEDVSNDRHKRSKTIFGSVAFAHRRHLNQKLVSPAKVKAIMRCSKDEVSMPKLELLLNAIRQEIEAETTIYFTSEQEVEQIANAIERCKSKEFYDEGDVPKPMGVYAISKYEAEKFVIQNCKKFLICRAGWMMGGGPKKDKKFVQKILKQIKDGKDELFIVDDKFGTPTYTLDFARNVEALIDTNNFGLYNMACEGNTSRLEVAEEILKILNLEKNIKITKVKSSYFSKTFFAQRPNSENLLNRKLNEKELNMMRPWRNTLREYLKKSYSDYL